MVRNYQRVVQFDLQGNRVAEYDTLTDAAKAVNAQVANISAACYNDHRSACGYVWRHKEDVEGLTKIKPFINKRDRAHASVVQFSKEGKYITGDIDDMSIHKDSD